MIAGRSKVLAKISIFTTISVIIAGYLFIVLGNVRFTKTVDYHADFNDVSLLAPGSEVRIAGVQVGKVAAVHIIDGDHAAVDFNVDKGVQLTRATDAVVRYKNLIGDRYLELDQDPNAPRSTALPIGGTIPATQTRPALDLDTLFNGFKPLFQGLDPTQINQLSGELIQVLQGEAGAITPLLTTVASFTSTLAKRDELIGSVIKNLDTVLQTIADRDDAVSTVITQLQQLVSGLNGRAPQTLDSVTAINSFTASATSLLTKVNPALSDDLPLLQAVTTTVNQQSDTIQTVFNELPQAYKTLMRTGSYGDFFNTYLCGIRVKLSDPTSKQPVITPYLVDSQVPRCK